MKTYRMIAVAGLILTSISSAFAAGGILPTGTGTNEVYGTIEGNGEVLQNVTLTDVNASGATNMDGSKIASGDIPEARMDANAVVKGDYTTDGGVIVASGAGTFAEETGDTLRTSLGLAIGTDVQAWDTDLDKLALNDGGSLTNLTPAALTNSVVDGNGIVDFTFDGSAAASVVVEADGDTLTVGASGVKVAAGKIGITELDTAETDARYIGTNSTGQTKAGALTIEGDFTVKADFVLTPSVVQTLATDANVAANAAMVVIAGDGGAVTCGMADGTAAGQVLTIRGNDAVNTVQLTNAACVPNFTLGTNDIISFVWDGVWIEQFRRDN